MPEEEPCLVLGWAHISASTRFRANGGPVLLPPRGYRPPWTRSCSTKRVEAPVVISFLQDGGYLRLGRDIAFARWMHMIAIQGESELGSFENSKAIPSFRSS
jgi:hypothetical protein